MNLGYVCAHVFSARLYESKGQPPVFVDHAFLKTYDPLTQGQARAGGVGELTGDGKHKFTVDGMLRTLVDSPRVDSQPVLAHVDVQKEQLDKVRESAR